MFEGITKAEMMTVDRATVTYHQFVLENQFQELVISEPVGTSLLKPNFDRLGHAAEP